MVSMIQSKAGKNIPTVKLVAAFWATGGTVKDAQQVCRDFGVALTNADTLRNEVRRFSDLRRERRNARTKYGKFSPVAASKSTPQSRLEDLRIQAVGKATRAALRVGDQVYIKLSRTAAPGAKYETVRDGEYKGAYKGWAKYSTTVTVTVRPDWRIRVERRGLAVVGGMLTLDAQPMDHKGEIEYFAATWVEQGRGYSATVVSGVIARSGGQEYHGPTMEAAGRGLAAKLRWANKTPAQKAAVEERLALAKVAATADRWIARYPGLQVCVSDARNTGACESGIRSWCGRVGIDVEQGCVGVEEIAAGYKAWPLPEVRAAVIYAAREGDE